MDIDPEVSGFTLMHWLLDSLEALMALHYYLHSCPRVDFRCFQHNAGRGNPIPKYS
jgi:hypothetical protein